MQLSYRSNRVLRDWDEAWTCLSGLPAKVTRKQRELLEKPMTTKELEAALKSLPNGKAPGRDGFNKEFVSWDGNLYYLSWSRLSVRSGREAQWERPSMRALSH